jgi:hypothetical protein
MRAQVREFAGEYFARSLERRRKRDASAAAQAVQPLVDDVRPASPNRTRQTPLSSNSVVLDYMSTSLKFDRNVVLDVRDVHLHLLHAFTCSTPCCASLLLLCSPSLTTSSMTMLPSITCCATDCASCFPAAEQAARRHCLRRCSVTSHRRPVPRAPTCARRSRCLPTKLAMTAKSCTTRLRRTRPTCWTGWWRTVTLRARRLTLIRRPCNVRPPCPSPTCAQSATASRFRYVGLLHRVFPPFA